MLKPTADHVKPRAHFGEDTRENLLPAHWFCNNRRGDMPVTEHVRKWLAKQVMEKFGQEIEALERARKKVAWWEV
jgi:5-methylcytosine-specific restriction endonuclease McrA